jgi:hypothetical protein
VTTTLGFIRKDVEVQIDTARELLDLVRQLKEAAGGEADVAQKQHLDRIAEHLAAATERLAKNAGNTGRAVGDLVRRAG